MLPRWMLLVSCLLACGDDSPMPAVDAGGCASDVECDDGIFCNGAETCEAGSCASGSPPCEGDARCSEADGMCIVGCENPDMDGDGHDAIACGGDDCDDADRDAFPGNTEVCDAEGRDEDCDPTTLGPDRDDDGFAPATCCNGDTCGMDCDDYARSVAPGATEVCNVVDDDCDGSVDEGVAGPGYRDADGDRHGDPSTEILGCAVSPEFSFVGDDCDDADPSTPGGEILGDGADNDCDGVVDEGDGSDLRTFWRDADGDGFGDRDGASVQSAVAVAGYSPTAGDCDDDDPAVHPGAPELCNGLDDDCNGLLDGEDDDGDGVPDASCSPAGGGDCDDRNPEVYPGAPELCDGVDNDCDDATPFDVACAPRDWFPDADGDGYGAGEPVVSAAPLDGHAARDGDCDDGDPRVNPGAPELCDGADQDCDGVADDRADHDCGGFRMGGFCAAGACVHFCQNGYGDCDSDASNGCETDLNRPASCGSCDTVCPTAANAEPGCMDFECTLTCLGAWADCNGDRLTDGCEVNTLADEANCGACGAACREGEDTVATCVGGSCDYVCAAGYGDCDGDLADPSPTTWCEVRTERDADDCGTCGTTCGGSTPICQSGGCTGWDLASSGASGPFVFVETRPGEMVLDGGEYHYAGDVRIPAGMTLRVQGTGVLDIRATGDIVVEGTIDVSGGPGSQTGSGLCGPGGGTANGYWKFAPPDIRGPGGTGSQGGDASMAARRGRVASAAATAAATAGRARGPTPCPAGAAAATRAAPAGRTAATPTCTAPAAAPTAAAPTAKGASRRASTPAATEARGRRAPTVAAAAPSARRRPRIWPSPRPSTPAPRGAAALEGSSAAASNMAGSAAAAAAARSGWPRAAP